MCDVLLLLESPARELRALAEEILAWCGYRHQLRAATALMLSDAPDVYTLVQRPEMLREPRMVFLVQSTGSTLLKPTMITFASVDELDVRFRSYIMSLKR